MRAARYFPVEPGPLRVKAGLFRFGHDFGNGADDARFFQVDAERDAYLAAKRAVPVERHQLDDSVGARRAVAAGLDFIAATWAHEHPSLACPVIVNEPARARALRLAFTLQEDFAIIRRGDEGVGDAVALFVCFPSGWRPERLLRAAFSSIHGPVPGFSDDKLGRSMVATMIERGPFVRFVWTLCGDAVFDHHPDSWPQGQRIRLEDAQALFFRVERQVTIPLPAVDAAVFLIRTSITPTHALGRDERSRLAQALSAMSDEIAAYKGLLAGKAHALRLLGAP